MPDQRLLPRLYPTSTYQRGNAILLHHAYPAPNRKRGERMSNYPVPQRASMYRQQMRARTTNQRATAEPEDDTYTTRTPRSAIVRFQPFDVTSLQGVTKIYRRLKRLPLIT